MRLLIIFFSFLLIAFFSNVGKAEVIKTSKHKVEFSKNAFDVGIISTFDASVVSTLANNLNPENYLLSEGRQTTSQNTPAILNSEFDNKYLTLNKYSITAEIYKGNSFAQINKLLLYR